MINYTIFNQSSSVSGTQISNMIKAINIFLTTVCKDWSIEPVQCVLGSGSNYPNNSILIQNLSDEEGALGYHYEVNGKAIGKVFATTILNYGGVVMYRDSHTFTVAQCLSHELLEMLGNNQINKWYMDNDSILWAGELCDAVESNLITYTLPGNIKVGLTDYVLPAYFSPDATRGPYNKLNTLTAPFTLSPGGYAIILVIENGYVDSIYGLTNKHEFALSNIKRQINSPSKMKSLIDRVKK